MSFVFGMMKRQFSSMFVLLNLLTDNILDYRNCCMYILFVLLLNANVQCVVHSLAYHSLKVTTLSSAIMFTY